MMYPLYSGSGGTSLRSTACSGGGGRGTAPAAQTTHQHPLRACLPARAIVTGLEREGLTVTLETVAAWSVEQRAEVSRWLAEHDLRRDDFAKSRVPYPAWLDQELGA
jgi:hypothetical protein